MDKATQRFTNEMLLDVLSLSHHATAIYATDNIIIEAANDAMIAFWGKDRTVIGKTLEDAVPELKGQPFIGMLRNVLLTGISDAGTGIAAELFVEGQLQTFYYDYEYTAIKNEAGETYCILHTASDVTERELNKHALELAREQEQALKIEQLLNEKLAAANEELTSVNEDLHEMQQRLLLLNNELEARVERRTRELSNYASRLRYMLSDAPVAIAVFTGRELFIESANKKALEAWGKTDEIIGKTLEEAIPEIIGQGFLPILDLVFTSGEPYVGNEVKALLPHGDLIQEAYTNFVYQPLKDADGNTTSIMLVASLITEQVLARKKVEHAEEMLRFALEAADIGTWFIDVKTQQMVTTPRLKELYGYNGNEDMTFLQAMAQVIDEHRGMVEEKINHAIAAGGRYDISFSARRFHDQKLVWLRALGKLVSDNNGTVRKFSGVVMDITEQKEDEQRKNDFIGMVSHELKTPLTSLIAYVQILQGRMAKTGDIFTINALSKMNIQLKKMGEMINGFLNVSRLESGKILLEKTDFNLQELLKDVVEETMLTVTTHELVFLPCDPPVIIHADQPKIAAVVSNLLSNAIKYSPRGKIVTIRCEATDNTILVSVKDEGMGIKPQDIDKLFDRFYRVNSKHTETISGFGIGLYLSAEIVQHHEGKIWVESKSGSGSTFYFSLPIHRDIKSSASS